MKAIRTDLTALARFAEIAREIMLPAIGTINSCISSTRVTIECLRTLGYEAEPLPVKLAVTSLKRHIAFTSGVSDEELATARGVRSAFGQGWRGHLVARVNRDMLVDSTLDQVSVAIPALTIPHKIFTFPIKGAADSFGVKYGVVLDNGEHATIEYVTTDDRSYESTEAWNDIVIPAIASMILRRM